MDSRRRALVLVGFLAPLGWLMARAPVFPTHLTSAVARGLKYLREIMKLGQKGDEEEDNEKLVRGVHLLTPLMLLVALVGSALSGAPIFLDYITSAVAAGLLLMAGFAASRRFPILPAIATVLAVQAHQSARAHFLYPILYERYGMWFEFQWFSVLALSAFVMHWSYAQHLKSRRPDPKPDPDAEREEDEA